MLMCAIDNHFPNLPSHLWNSLPLESCIIHSLPPLKNCLEAVLFFYDFSLYCACEAPGQGYIFWSFYVNVAKAACVGELNN